VNDPTHRSPLTTRWCGLVVPALQVKDTGKPLPDRERDGTGLRLRSCRAIVELHGGVMTAYARASGTAGGLRGGRMDSYADLRLFHTFLMYPDVYPAGRGAAFHIELPVSPIPGLTTARKPKGTGHFGVDKVRALLRPRPLPSLFPRCESFSFTSFSLFASVVFVF
jgi:hypothetical protein